jgi:hypothetical protein
MRLSYWTCRSGVQIPGGERDFSLLQNVQTHLRPTQPPIQLGPWVFPGGKAAGREVNHSLPSGAEVKIEWSYTSTPSICLQVVEKDNIAFTFPFSSE